MSDWLEAWAVLDREYCFFAEKTTDWLRVRDEYARRCALVESPDGFKRVLQAALTELYDAHTHVHDTPAGTPRFPPFDVIADEDRDGGARVTAVQSGSDAQLAGLLVGDVVQAVDGVTLVQAATALEAQCLLRPDPVARRYAVVTALSGRRGAERLFDVQRDDDRLRLSLRFTNTPERPPVEWKEVAPGVGLIAIHTFGPPEVVPAFDRALAALRKSRALLLDVRDNGGGDTAVARPIMGRFIRTTAPYARMRKREGRGLSAPWVESVAPRGPFRYDGDLAVLVNGFSASMAEGFAMGLRGLGRAVVVGERMMGLGAAVKTVSLPGTGVRFQFSAEPVYDLNDEPRWRFTPDLVVEPGQDIELGARTRLSP